MRTGGTVISATALSYNDVFSELLGAHLSRYPTVPFFFFENGQVVDFMVEEGMVPSPTDAIEVLEKAYSFDVKNIQDGWYCLYEPTHELWVFSRILNSMELERKHNAELQVLKKTLKQYLFDISPREFETLLFNLFRTMNEYEYPVARPMTRDGGYEMCVRFTDPVTNSKDRILIQAKHEDRPVPVSHTREFIGTLDVESRLRRSRLRLRGIMVSLMPPSPDSEAAAQNSNFSIDFLCAEDIVNLMIKHSVGCRETTHSIPIVDNAFWDEVSG